MNCFEEMQQVRIVSNSAQNALRDPSTSIWKQSYSARSASEVFLKAKARISNSFDEDASFWFHKAESSLRDLMASVPWCFRPLMLMPFSIFKV